MIDACSKIRQLAKLNHIVFEQKGLRGGIDKQFLDYLAYCGMDEAEFVRNALSQLQPYMIEKKIENREAVNYVCMIDDLYRILVSIVLAEDGQENIEVIFPADETGGVGVGNIDKKLPTHVPVFADCVLAVVENQNRYEVRVLVQRGLAILPMILPAVKKQGMFWVERKAINRELVSACNNYIMDLYTSDLDLDFDQIKIFSPLQQISFTAEGRDSFSNVSALIDSVCIQNDYVSKKIADFALVTYLRNLWLTRELRCELLNLLEEKYTYSGIKDINLLLDRVKTNLCLYRLDSIVDKGLKTELI